MTFFEIDRRGCRLETIMDQDSCKSVLELFSFKSCYPDNFYFDVSKEYQKIFDPYIWKLNENGASRLTYLTGCLTKLPGKHIPLLSSCLPSKPKAEAFVIVLVWLNPATANSIRHCLCNPFVCEIFPFLIKPRPPHIYFGVCQHLADSPFPRCQYCSVVSAVLSVVQCWSVFKK